MNSHIAKLIERIRLLEAELQTELARHRTDLAFSVRGRLVRFEERVLQRHRQLRVPLSRYLRDARPLMIITAPIIYSLIVPFALLDLFVTVYQRICFPIYGIPRARRRDYIVIDRAHLAYLNVIERMNCTYCSYANGVIAYVREVASLTEQYWCPIKHARRVIGAHERYARFADFGDAENYRQELQTLRDEVQKARETPS